MGTARPRVYTIPSGAPFARALCEGVIARAGFDPLLLSDALVLVPTRRAARALHEVFAETLGGAALLPRIRPLGDAGDDQDLFDLAADDLALVPPIAPLRRQLLLAMLVQRWGIAKGTPMGFAQALASAGELARFLDEAITHGADLRRLDALAPESLAAHWSEVVGFLKIIADQWPKQLEAEGASEPAANRDARLRALAESLTANPPRAPVIAAGSTGSIPATAALLKTVAHLPTGAVVLPGLDQDLDDAAWNALDPSHAQFGMAQLLKVIGLAREEVELWSPLPGAYPGRAERVRFLSEALRPPPTTDHWRDLADRGGAALAPGLANLSIVEAENAREEALVIACALREALESKARRAALVTPDRALARRVAAELARWDITIDDSAGTMLPQTPVGAFLALLAHAAAERFAPVPLLALLKHPLAAGGEDRFAFRRNVRALELAALRGLRPEPGLEGIAARLARVNAPEGLRNWFAGLARLLAPFGAAMLQKEATLAELAHAHCAAAEALAATRSRPGASLIWRGEAGEAAALLMSELGRFARDVSLSPARHYAEAFRALAAMRAVRPPYNLHPRLAILGPLEARLLDFDLVVLSGLNEGTWPEPAATDPWLSRPMRAELGLEAPERRIGLSAHDFATLAAGREVLITRSLKENGAPAVPSRWLLRIRQLARGLGIEGALGARDHLLAWARALDWGAREHRALRPAPRPPVAARPRTLSVTEIETWLRDPYAIYAAHVLRLKKLKPIDQEPGPAERGTAIHRALERFLTRFPVLPPDALEQLLRLGEEAFAEAGATQAVLALWRPRFRRAARWFLAYEAERRREVASTFVEARGTLAVPTCTEFQLRGRADRIDLHRDGQVSIIDYKTGRVPTDRQIELLLSPQLPLEGAMLMAGAFGEIRAERLNALIHIQLSGGDPPGRECVFRSDATAIAREAIARLADYIARFSDPEEPYRSREMPFRASDEGDYDHLARVREWLVEQEGEEP